MDCPDGWTRVDSEYTSWAFVAVRLGVGSGLFSWIMVWIVSFESGSSLRAGRLDRMASESGLEVSSLVSLLLGLRRALSARAWMAFLAFLLPKAWVRAALVAFLGVWELLLTSLGSLSVWCCRTIARAIRWLVSMNCKVFLVGS